MPTLITGQAGDTPWRILIRWQRGLLWPGREVILEWDGRPLARGLWPAFLPYHTLIATLPEGSGQRRLELRLTRAEGRIRHQLILDRRPLDRGEGRGGHPGPQGTRAVLERGPRRLFLFRYLPAYTLTLTAPATLAAGGAGLGKFLMLGAALAALQAGLTWLSAFLDQAQRRRVRLYETRTDP